MLINKENITNFLPQRPPFVMIDELLTANENGFTSHFKVLDSNLFHTNGTLSESAVVENIAQTCAAGFGYVGCQSGGEAGRIGFIGAITRLTNFSSASLGDIIETKIEVLNTFENIHLVQGTATANGTKLLECQMKIVLA